MPPSYAGHNLRGRSFKGQNLTGANFSNADIRGANFTNAILKNANFNNAKAGLQRRWVILLLIVPLLPLASAVIYSISLGLSAAYIFDTKHTGSVFIGSVCIIVVAVFCIVTLRNNLIAGLGVVAVILVLVLPTVFILVVAFPNGFSVIRTSPKGFPLIFGLVFSVAFILFSIFIGWSIRNRYDQNVWFDSVINTFSATGGTSFRSTNLINADFTGAILKNTDFRKANLTRTRFYEAKKLDFARVDDTILVNRAVLNLLVTCNGRGKSYAGLNLRGANLIGADLKKANLKDANITEATFEGACLEWANLTLVQAVGTNLTSAQMTGACIEAWNIESTTKLDNVDCRFIYLLENPKPGTDDRECRPSSGEFQPGEFTKLFEEVLNTVDFIFRNGIDWKAFVNAFQTVQKQNEDTELALQSIENKGDGVVIVKVGVPDGADKDKIHSDFTQSYQLALQAVEEKYKAQLQAKDEQIVFYRKQSGEITEIVKLLANKPINVQVYNKVENKNMTNSNDASRKIEIGNVGRDFNASGQALNLGDISGTVTNTINELAASPEPDKPGIKELLTQLQAAIEADTNLSKEDKAEALEQVKALAEAGKSPQEGAMQKAAKTAIKILKGTISSLPSATKLVEQCSNLLPLISNFLGLG
ncbi:MAG: pentapeptide repeat-containing protein [Nostoc sp. DedVER02]|uniref:pentapeptide repeat-containing protein n=1 Tax=unclassified Nostoc TaxID=2593658 RepID=UPI002AD47256|nr:MULTISPECIES: pentapeptide repeat-containing protein [unclassified Nostoc]MDZ7990407.1 pentapeptide repeat-containing protein [Nostoc sp. DedVER02]MDZ8115901.1 pentapeptide repeat-containing protein [Nostoc sp. DedVER01b]